MRFVCAAVAAVCVAGSASAAGLPDLLAGKQSLVTYYGIGTINEVYIENADYAPEIFDDVVGKKFRIKASFWMWLEREEDRPLTDQVPLSFSFTRLDTGEVWGNAGNVWGEGIQPYGIGVYDDPSWWGYAGAASYSFAADRGRFSFRLLYELPRPSYDLYWSEAYGDWKITKMTVSVPEPATWAMFIAGFGLVGAAVRRQGRAVPARLAA